MTAFLDFCRWLENTPVGEAMRNSRWVAPTVEIFHICGIIALLTSTTILALRLLGCTFRAEPVSKLAKRLLPWARFGFIVVAATGLLLFSSEATRYYANLVFRLKMLMIVLAGLNTLVFNGRCISECPRGTKRGYLRHSERGLPLAFDPAVGWRRCRWKIDRLLPARILLLEVGKFRRDRTKLANANAVLEVHGALGHAGFVPLCSPKPPRKHKRRSIALRPEPRSLWSLGESRIGTESWNPSDPAGLKTEDGTPSLPEALALTKAHSSGHGPNASDVSNTDAVVLNCDPPGIRELPFTLIRSESFRLQAKCSFFTRRPRCGAKSIWTGARSRLMWTPLGSVIRLAGTKRGTLVVETVGERADTWLDNVGRPTATPCMSWNATAAPTLTPCALTSRSITRKCTQSPGAGAKRGDCLLRG